MARLMSLIFNIYNYIAGFSLIRNGNISLLKYSIIYVIYSLTLVSKWQFKLLHPDISSYQCKFFASCLLKHRFRMVIQITFSEAAIC